ncbi:MAG TPA: hypothetical protein ACFYD4_06185 [Candidatus Wunengus sp. YC61]|uniref:hypothetical protein n=1 Tax=Candidatus Wunengus sp. YC61 TaxID=3367698 RepID=UPI00402912B7
MKDVQKEEEFEAFIKLIEDGSVNAMEHWVSIADSLGVHRNTINEWKKSPRARKAISEGIKRALNGMENVGKRDWRMWREKVALLTEEMEKKRDNGLSSTTNNLIVISDDKLAQFLYGFTKRLSVSEDTVGSQENAAGGENTPVPENSGNGSTEV